MGLASIGFLLPNIYILFTCLFMMGLQSSLFGPAKYSILPEILDEKKLVKGNAYVEMGTFISILLGTILGGIIISLDNGELLTCIAILILALFGMFASSKIRGLKPVNPELKIQKNIFVGTIRIISVAREIKSIWLSVLAVSWFWFLGAALLSIFPSYVKDTLGGNEQVVTCFLTLFCLGAAIGSILSEKFSGHRAELGLVPIGAIGMSVFLFDLYTIEYPLIEFIQPLGLIDMIKSLDVFPQIMIDLFMVSLFSGVYSVPLYTFIQERSDKKKLSRIIAANNIMNALFMVSSSIMLLILYKFNFSMSEIFLVLCILNMTVSFYVFFVVRDFLLRLFGMILAKILYRVSFKGFDNLPKNEAAILSCNHVSFVDWLIIVGMIDRPVRFVMYYKFFENPLFKFFCKGAKAIPIASKSEKPDIYKKSFELIKEAYKEGDLLCILPEGKITQDGELSDFRHGLTKIIEQCPMPIIPMALTGLWGSFFSRKYGSALSEPRVILKNFRKKVQLEAAEMIEPEDFNLEDLKERTEKLIRDSSF